MLQSDVGTDSQRNFSKRQLCIELSISSSFKTTGLHASNRWQPKLAHAWQTRWPQTHPKKRNRFAPKPRPVMLEPGCRSQHSYDAWVLSMDSSSAKSCTACTLRRSSCKRHVAAQGTACVSPGPKQNEATQQLHFTLCCRSHVETMHGVLWMVAKQKLNVTG